MFNIHDRQRDAFMLEGAFEIKGYDWWWHSFTGYNTSTGEEKSFFIEFFAVNPALGGETPVFGQLEENKKYGIRPSYLMIKAGAWGENAKQIHRFFGWDSVNLSKDIPFSVMAEDCYCSETQIRGSVELSEEESKKHPEYMSDSGKMTWDLAIDKKIAFNVGYGADTLARKSKAFEMYWHAEGMKTEYSGSVTFDGIEYEIRPETSYGYADKNWGSDFTSPWVWLSSNNLTSRVSGEKLNNSVFDIGGGRPKVFNFPLERKLLGAFYYEGTEYEFNFSKVWHVPMTKFKCEETDTQIIWKILQETPRAKMYTMVSCKKSDMLLVEYESPDGEHRHNRLWNGGNGTGRIKLYEKYMNEWMLIDDIDARNIGCEYGEYDE